MTTGLFFLSGRPGSNWRHSAWKADALPTELLPHLLKNTLQKVISKWLNKQAQILKRGKNKSF